MANNLKKLRVAAGLSQPVFAERLGTSRCNVQFLENGKRRLNLDWITKAAAILGVDPGKIVEDGPNPLPNTGGSER